MSTQGEIVDAFRAAMREQGININGEIIADDRRHRVAAEGDKQAKRDAWYILHLNGVPAGAFGHHRMYPGRTFLWKAEGGARDQLSPEERRELARKIKEDNARRKADEERQYAEAAERARKLWADAKPCTSHPYLTRKGIQPHGARQMAWRGQLCVVVPFIRASAIVGLQFIGGTKWGELGRDKDFLPGAQKRGAYFVIGKLAAGVKPKRLYIAEGFATGASVHQATGDLVVCAFDCGNLETVARYMREKFPEAEIIIAADNDQWTLEPLANPGEHYANEAARHVGARVVLPPFPHDAEGRPTDWNDYQQIHGIGAVREALESQQTEQTAHDREEPPPHSPEDMGELDDSIPSDYGPEEPRAIGGDGMPFQVLGVDRGRYYYLPHGSQQVVELSASGHTKLNLVQLAPLSWWSRRFPSRKDGFSTDEAADELMRACEARGIYDPLRLRGRGAWWDDGRTVLHLGDRVVVGDDVMPVAKFRSRYVYEAAPAMRAALANPLSVAEAHPFVELCSMLSWERPISAKLLAGWCFIAPICGALQWRPHIWITGGAGTGKSYIMEAIVRRTLGDWALAVQSETTEAGLRQTLGNDALPIAFDEAESEDQRAQQRIQNVMALMRQASSENGAIIVKGGAGGSSKAYRIRSCFAFASIGVGVQQHADVTRVSVLSLVKNERADAAQHFENLKATVATLLSEDYVTRLQARAIKLIPVIRRNAEVFAAVGASVLGARRTGDQIGALLAGAYALHSNAEISPEKARQFIEAQDWTEESSHDTADELGCVARLSEHLLRIGQIERSVGELVAIARGLKFDEGVKREDAEAHLLRHGFKVAPDRVSIPNKHSSIERMLERTPWAKDWGRILCRLPGALKLKQARYGSGNAQRGVAVPLSYFVAERGEPAPETF